jgi:hypothetical protein
MLKAVWLRDRKFRLSRPIDAVAEKPVSAQLFGRRLVPWVESISDYSTRASRISSLEWGIRIGRAGQAAASCSYPVECAMNSSRVWQMIAAGARPCADALIVAFRA